MPVTHAKNVTVADWSGVVTVANSTGGTTTNQASNLARPSDWVSNHVVNLSASEVAPVFQFTNGLSSTTAAGGITVGVDSVGYFQPYLGISSVLQAPLVGTWTFDPVIVPFALGSGQINALVSSLNPFLHGGVFSAASTGSVTRYQTCYQQFALYKLGTGASTTRLESVWSSDASILATWERRLGTANTSSGTISNMLTLSFPSQFNASGGVTYGSTTASGTRSMGASTVASTVIDSLVTAAGTYVSGSIMQIWGFNTSLPAGDYWMAHMWSSSTSSTGTQGGLTSSGTMLPVPSVFYVQEFIANSYKRVGVSVSDTSSCLQMFHGSLATTTSSPTAVVATSDIRNLANNYLRYWNYQQSSY